MALALFKRWVAWKSAFPYSEIASLWILPFSRLFGKPYDEQLTSSTIIGCCPGLQDTRVTHQNDDLHKGALSQYILEIRDLAFSKES